MIEERFSRPAAGSGSGDGAAERGGRTASGRVTGRLGIAPRRLLILASLWAGLAGLISFGVGEAKFLEAKAKRDRFVAAGRTVEGLSTATRDAAARTTSVRLHAVFGGLVGLFMGILGGWARRSWRSALVAGAVGALIGASAGAAVPFFLLPAYARYRQVHGGDLAASLLLHAGLWAGIGAAGGLALGLGLGGPLRAWQSALGGLLGAVGGAILFDFLGAFFFPLEETGLPTSTSARTRLLARLMVAVLAAVSAAWAACQIEAREKTMEGNLPGEQRIP
jgi:hypothetical protein